MMRNETQDPVMVPTDTFLFFATVKLSMVPRKKCENGVCFFEKCSDLLTAQHAVEWSTLVNSRQGRGLDGCVRKDSVFFPMGAVLQARIRVANIKM